MSKEGKFTPIPDSQTPRLRTNVELPFQLQDHIGLNVGKIQTLCQLAGFRHLRLETMEDPKTSKSSVMVVGINSHNTALGGKPEIKTVPIHEESINKLEGNNFKQAAWNNLNIYLNQEEMKQRMLLTNKDVRQVNNWAKDINKALTQGIVRAGVKNLITGMEIGEQFAAFVTYFSVIWGRIDPNMKSIMIFLGQGLTHFIGSYKYGFEDFSKGTGYRGSLLPAIELDRVFALLLIANSSKLAKPC